MVWPRQNLQGPPSPEIFFAYISNPTSAGVAFVNANANVTPSIVIDGDSEFMAIWLIASSTGTFRMRFQDGATGRNFMSGYVNNVNLFGTAQLPFPMLPPYTFQNRGSIALDIVDTSGANNTIQIAFIGKKVFRSGTAGAAGAVAQGALGLLGALALPIFSGLRGLFARSGERPALAPDGAAIPVELDPALAMEPGYLSGVVLG